MNIEVYAYRPHYATTVTFTTRYRLGTQPDSDKNLHPTNTLITHSDYHGTPIQYIIYDTDNIGTLCYHPIDHIGQLYGDTTNRQHLQINLANHQSPRPYVSVHLQSCPYVSVTSNPVSAVGINPTQSQPIPTDPNRSGSIPSDPKPGARLCQFSPVSARSGHSRKTYI